MSEAPELIPAATVLLLRNGESGVEVLMVRRNSKIAFGGMWAFPGGRVDDDDADTEIDTVTGAGETTGNGDSSTVGFDAGGFELCGLTPSVEEAGRAAGEVLAVSRRAAVREVREETALEIEPGFLVPWSFWVPPPRSVMARTGPVRRFATWFFAVDAPRSEVTIDHGEIHDHEWLTPAGALTKHHAGDIELAPPTWISLWQLSRHDSAGSALSWARENKPRFFQTKPLQRKPLTLAWGGDAAYELDPEHHDVIGVDGGRNRLTMRSEGWVYEFTV